MTDKKRFIAIHVAVGLGIVGILELSGAFAQHTELDADEGGLSIRTVLALIVLIASALSVLGNVIWSFFNQHSYDKLKEVISEQEELIRSHERRYKNLQCTLSETETHYAQQVKGLEADVERLKVSGRAVVTENNRLRSILRRHGWEEEEEEA